MIKVYLPTLIAVLIGIMDMKAQVTTTPTPLQEDSKDVVIYFHADQGNKGLMGVAPPQEVYAHTGVITNLSKDDSDWKYAPEWGKNEKKYKLEWVEANLWKLTIGDIHSYYGVPVTETIKKLAFVFRNGTKDSSGNYKEGKASGNKDILVDMVDSGLQIAMQTNPAVNVVTQPTYVTLTVSTTIAADINLYVNDYLIKSERNSNSLTLEYYVDQPGDYKVLATATANGETVSVSGDYVYLGQAIEKPYPSNDGEPVMGPVTNSDGSVTFCLAAPGMSNVMILGSWNDYLNTSAQQLYYTDYNLFNPVYPSDAGYSGKTRYFWTTISADLINNPDENYIYYYLVNGSIPTANGGVDNLTNYVGDPYARLVLDPENDRYLTSEVFENLPEYPYEYVSGVPVAVYQQNLNVYDWQSKNFEMPDKDNLIIYELLLRDFTGTEGKAEGNGTVKKAMERIEYLKTLGVNAIELMPICEFSGNLSWGYNPNFYFAPDKAYGSPDDYKAFIDLCHQNGMAVILDMVFNQSDQYHPWYQMYGGNVNSPMFNSTYGGENGAPHAYSVFFDWNQDYPLVQQQWRDVIEYWLTQYNFDGFRFDLVKGLGSNSSYGTASDSNTNKYNKSRVAQMAYLNSVIQDVKPGAYCINEDLATSQEETEMGNDGELCWANVNWAACQFAMGYPYDADSGATDLNRLYAPRDSNRPWGSTVSYLESHDENRMAWSQSKWGVSGVKGNEANSCLRLASAAAIMLMTPGSHMIWQYGELGINEDIESDRTGNKVVQFNTLFNNQYHRSIYNSYCQLNEIRFKNTEFFTKEASFTINCKAPNNSWPANGFLLYSVANGKELITAVNPNVTGNLNINYDFLKNANDNYKILSQSYLGGASFNVSDKTISVPANSYVVIGDANLQEAGIENILSNTESSSLMARGGYGEVIIDYAAQEAIVYSLNGKAAGRIKGSGRIAVSAGLYIIKSGKEALKVIVK